LRFHFRTNSSETGAGRRGTRGRVTMVTMISGDVDLFLMLL